MFVLMIARRLRHNRKSTTEKEGMMTPDNLKFTRTHEWARLDGGIVTVGISRFAVEQLGDIVFVELPKVGKSIAADAPFGVIESVKAAVDLVSPISGEVVGSNADATTDFQAISQDPYGKGWMLKVRPSKAAELDALMTPEQYDAFTQSEQAGH
jgi:glycine cleavage system H protein